MTNETTPQIRANAKELDIRLKNEDEDRWLATRYAPKAIREKLVSFYLLVLELDRALTMSEPMLGQIRIQWWREVIAQIHEGEDVRQHDLALALKDDLDGQAIRPRLDALLASYDDVLEGVENDDNPPRVETGAHIALCAAALISSDFEAHQEKIAACGRAYLAARIGSACAAPRLETAKHEFPKIPAEFGGAIAYVATVPAYLKHEMPGGLIRRWKIFKAILSGKVS